MAVFENSFRFQSALRAIDAANAEDPAIEKADGRLIPRALLYAHRMSATLRDYAPHASEAVCLAVRCQHFRRWTVPLDTYPLGRAGYHRWRSELAVLQAQWAGKTLRKVGYPEDMVGHIEGLLRKERLGENPETQLVEDTACLVFLKHYLTEFAQRHARPKLIGVLRETWYKMSPRARSAASRLELPPQIGELLGDALSGAVERSQEQPKTLEAQRVTV